MAYPSVTAQEIPMACVAADMAEAMAMVRDTAAEAVIANTLE